MSVEELTDAFLGTIFRDNLSVEAFVGALGDERTRLLPRTLISIMVVSCSSSEAPARYIIHRPRGFIQDLGCFGAEGFRSGRNPPNTACQQHLALVLRRHRHQVLKRFVWSGCRS